jgi:hypothetical protein
MTLDQLSLARALQAWLHSYQAVHGPLSEDEAEVYRSLGGFLLAVAQEEEDELTPSGVPYTTDYPQEEP